MHLKRVIPCLDVDAGRVVKGTNFVNLRDAGDPVELAERYDAEGADELTFLDVTASAHDRSTMYDVVSRTAGEVFIPLTVGGGVSSLADLRALAALAPFGVEGCIVGRALYAGAFTLPEALAAVSGSGRPPGERGATRAGRLASAPGTRSGERAE